jgi:hypothetical protein
LQNAPASSLVAFRISPGASSLPYFDTMRQVAFTCASSTLVESQTQRTGSPRFHAA